MINLFFGNVYHNGARSLYCEMNHRELKVMSEGVKTASTEELSFFTSTMSFMAMGVFWSSGGNIETSIIKIFGWLYKYVYVYNICLS